MAFTYHDNITGKGTFDLAVTDAVARKPNGAVTIVLKDGSLYLAEKPEIAALTPTSTLAEVIAALKA